MRHGPFIFLALLAALLGGCVSGAKSISKNTAQFDGANRLTNTITPLLRSMSQTWNHQGLLSTVTDPMRQTTSLYYDGKSRLTNRTDNVGTVLYGYDPNNNLTNVVGQASSLSMTYDAYNRMSSFKDAYGNLIQYRYDANGNLTNLVYPGGKNVYYTFDNDNHLIQVRDWANRVTSFTYDLAGRLLTITRPNGTFRTLSYDSAGELTNIWEQMPNGLPIAWLRHNWNPNSTMQWEFAAPLPHSVTLPTRNMTYDDDNRLATLDGLNVTEDADGNLTYGPLTNDTFTSFTYDARNRLISAGGVTNEYDGANNRIGQFYGTNSLNYVINPNSSLPQVFERIKNGVTTYYIYGAGLLYQVTETATSTNALYYHYDYRGSTIALTDDNGYIRDRFEYSLYGTMTYRAGTDDTPFLFNGRYSVMSDPNGLLYMSARYYSPYICRFLSPDPSGFNGGLNWYAYADLNPVSYLDPFGLSFWSVTGHFGEGVAVGAVVTAGVIIAAPEIAAAGAGALVWAGVSEAAATTFAVGAVDTGLLVAGGTGLALNGADTINNAFQGNWDAVAYNAGNLVGGYGVGASPFFGSSSGGRYLADNLGIIGGNGPSGAPQLSPFDLPGAWNYEVANRLNLNAPDSNLGAWSASAPTPFSGGTSATGIASGIGSGADLVNQYGATAVDWLGNLIPSTSTGKH